MIQKANNTGTTYFRDAKGSVVMLISSTPVKLSPADANNNRADDGR